MARTKRITTLRYGKGGRYRAQLNPPLEVWAFGYNFLSYAYGDDLTRTIRNHLIELITSDIAFQLIVQRNSNPEYFKRKLNQYLCEEVDLDLQVVAQEYWRKVGL